MECWEALKVAEALKEAAIVWLLQGPGFGHQISLFHGCSQGWQKLPASCWQAQEDVVVEGCLAAFVNTSLISSPKARFVWPSRAGWAREGKPCSAQRNLPYYLCQCHDRGVGTKKALGFQNLRKIVSTARCEKGSQKTQIMVSFQGCFMKGTARGRWACGTFDCDAGLWEGR